MAKNTKTNLTKWEALHLKELEKYETRVRRIYEEAASEAALLGVSIKDFDPNKPFTFDDYPQTKKKIESLMQALAHDVQATVESGVRSGWELANEKNDALCDRVFGKKNGQLTEQEKKRYYANHEDALQAFLQRKTTGEGLKLSDRVWRYTNAYKEEIEMALDLGMRDGMSAAEMTKSLRQYLQHPNMLFRRVRDEHGQLHLSKRAAAFHPSRGVYRSSYMNARRLAVTENNIAYRTSDHLRVQDLDFVVGIRIVMSNNHTCKGRDGKPHPFMDICDQLSAPLHFTESETRGKYPKDFKFTGWHPHCRCHIETIMKTQEELDRDLQKILNGEDTDTHSKNEVTDMPDEFNDWVKDNETRIKVAEQNGRLPYFLKDNKKFYTRILDPNAVQEAQTILEIKRTRTMALNVMRVAQEWGEVDFSELEALISVGNQDEIREAAKNVARQIIKQRNFEASVADLIPDVHKWHKTFTATELQATHDAISKTFARFSWDFNTETNIEYLKKKLTYEISWMETKGRKYSTWEISRNAYKERLALVERRGQMLDIRKSIADELTFVITTRSKIAKQLAADFDTMFADNNADIAKLQNKATEIKTKVDDLKKAAAKNAAKKTSLFTPKTDAETKKEFIEYAKSLGIQLRDSEVVVDKGFIHLQGDQHEKLYEALRPETAQERRQIWNHQSSGKQRWGASGYVQTGNSFKINGDFRSTKVLGELDNSAAGKKRIAALQSHGATIDDIVTIQTLDKKISEFSLPIQIRVTRYVDTSALSSIFGETIDGTYNFELRNAILKSKQQIQTDPAFLSASTNEKQNVFYSRYNVKLEIEVPPNTPMYLSDNYEESEVVFGRATNLTFKEVNLQGGYLVIRCQITK